MTILMAHGFRRQAYLIHEAYKRMPNIVVHGFHRLSSFLSGQKGTKEPPGTKFPGLSFIHPGFLEGLRRPGLSAGNYMRLPVATAVLHPYKEASLFGVLPQMSELVFRVEKIIFL
jgi:hypothetical protein